MMRTATVIIVDDHPGNQRMHRRTFEAQGYRVVACASESEALDALARLEKPAIFVVDRLMPDMDSDHFIGCVFAHGVRYGIRHRVLSISGMMIEEVSPREAETACVARMLRSGESV